MSVAISKPSGEVSDQERRVGGSAERRPDRTPGVRCFNWLARGAEALGLKFRIDVDRMLQNVRKRTGLEPIDQRFQEPLRLLADALNDEAHLHPFGRIMMSFGLRLFLQNRICLEHAWKSRPELLETPVRRPLYVIGLPRTGTTLLYNLLCQDPRGRPLMGWESLFPIAPPRGPDRRRVRGRRFVARLNRLAPRLKAVHEFVSDGPEECTWLLHNSFLSGSFLLQARIPTYADYLKALPREAWRRVYAEYAQTLQLLQHDSAGRHWVLKSPAHQVGLAALMDVIPDACIVQTHRDPRKVIPSCCSLFSVVRGLYSDDVCDRTLGEEVLDELDIALTRAMAARDERPDRVFDVRFERLMDDPVGTVKSIYRRFGYDYDPRMDDAMRRWLRDNPQGKHGKHAYSLEQFGLTEQRVAEVFGGYQRRYESITDPREFSG
jgi:hypothetical protein